MATDPKKDQEIRDEKLEDAAGGRIPDGSQLDDGQSDDAGTSSKRFSV